MTEEVLDQKQETILDVPWVVAEPEEERDISDAEREAFSALWSIVYERRSNLGFSYAQCTPSRGWSSTVGWSALSPKSGHLTQPKDWGGGGIWDRAPEGAVHVAYWSDPFTFSTEYTWSNAQGEVILRERLDSVW